MQTWKCMVLHSFFINRVHKAILTKPRLWWNVIFELDGGLMSFTAAHDLNLKERLQYIRKIVRKNPQTTFLRARFALNILCWGQSDERRFFGMWWTTRFFFSVELFCYVLQNWPKSFLKTQKSKSALPVL